MQRVSVVGPSGAGKTTFAARLAASLAVPHVEIDALHWGPEWTAATPDELRAAVRPILDGDAWVVDGNYLSKLGPIVWDRADSVVWLDLPRRTIMRRVLWRTVRRAATRQELWSGNREGWRGLAFWREDSILRWAWTSHARLHAEYAAAMDDPAWARLTFSRLRGRRDIERFLDVVP